MIGTVGPGLPIDLLEATGRYSGPLAWDTDRATPKADQWLESKFPVWAASILEDWADGAVDHLDTVLFSRADDAAQRLYYYVCELQRRGLIGGPKALICDVAKVRRPSSEAHTIAAVQRLADAFAVNDTSLEEGIVATNRRRSAAEALAGKTPVCLLLGTPAPTERLSQAIAGAGFTAVGTTLREAWADLGPMVAEGTGKPAAAIGRQIHARPDDQRGFQDNAQLSLEQARLSGASAAVLWYTEEDEARVWQLTRIRDALASAGIPSLIQTRRDAAARDGTPEEIRSFLEGLAL